MVAEVEPVDRRQAVEFIDRKSMSEHLVVVVVRHLRIVVSWGFGPYRTEITWGHHLRKYCSVVESAIEVVRK